MESEGSLPHLQKPTTCPYPESAQPSQCPLILLLEDPFWYYPPIYVWVSKVNFYVLALQFVSGLEEMWFHNIN
jgi:hypothetical protein